MTDPRILRTRHVVHEAALAVLGERGFSDFTVEAVAARAGVGKSTIYRHWTDHVDLIADTLEALNQQPLPAGDGETARQRIEALLMHLAEAMADPILSATVPALIEAAEHHPRIARFFHAYSARRRQALVDAIAAGLDTGELPGHVDPEMTALALSGAIFYRRTMTHTPMSVEEARRMVAVVLPAPGPD